LSRSKRGPTEKGRVMNECWLDTDTIGLSSRWQRGRRYSSQ